MNFLQKKKKNNKRRKIMPKIAVLFSVINQNTVYDTKQTIITVALLLSVILMLFDVTNN